MPGYCFNVNFTYAMFINVNNNEQEITMSDIHSHI